jgi:hypothetical protein
MSWACGDVIVHREIAWGRPWLAIPERVVDDTDDLLVTYVQSGAPFGYAPGPWPTESGRHPRYLNQAWPGHPAWETPELPSGWGDDETS